MSIRDAIYSRLSGFAGLSALVGARIHWVRAPQGVDLPCVVFSLLSASRESAMTRDTGTVRSRWQVMSLDREHTDAEAVSEQVRAALQRLQDTTVSSVVIDSVFLRDEADVYDDDVELAGIVLTFDINYREASL